MIADYARKGAKVAAEVIRKVSGLLSKVIIGGKLRGAGSVSVPKTSFPNYIYREQIRIANVLIKARNLKARNKL